MALGKARTNKRSSSASYTSTVTTVIIIALCVLGVWMLTSDNIITPQSTNRASITSSADQKITNPVRKPNDKENQGAFEDNPGDLPEDALKSDEPQRSQSHEDSGEATVEGTTNQAEEGSEKQEGGDVEDENQGKESGTGDDAGQGNVEEKETAGEQEKQDAQETQVSEESTVTQNQNLEQQSSTENSAEHESLKDSENEGRENNTNQNNNEQQDQAEESTNKEDKQSRTEDEGRNEDSAKQFPDENQKGKQQEDEGQSNEKQGEDSNGNEKPVMFSDETKQEISAKPVDEEMIMKDNDQQSKPATQELNSGGSEEQEESKQDSQNEGGGSTQDNNDKDSSTESGGGSTQENNYQDSTTESTQEKQGETNSLPNSGIPKESKESRKSWSTQAAESDKEKERRKDKRSEKEDGSIYGYTWHLCNQTAGPDYIPCLDNVKALKQLHSTKHFEHRERHCPEDPPTCLVPMPEGYKIPIPWPTSRDKIWFYNVPHTTLAEVKGHQNWVKVTGEFLTFPGGGTQFIHGALHYIDFIQQSVPGIAWGKRTRVVLDVGCGVASFGGYLFNRDVLTMSFAPKDEHEAQVQFALERGIPAISAVMGSQRLPFPSGVFDLVHCARCRVPWHAEGGRLLLELNRVLRPGGHFVWSATPVYQKLQEDVEIWEAMSSLTASMCWKLETIQKDAINKIGAAIYRKPSNNQCYKQRKQNSPPMCKDDDDPNAAWYVPLQPCMHRVPEDPTQRGSKWPIRWAKRMRMPPYWLNQSQMGIYGKPAPDDFTTDYEHWKQVVNNSYLKGLGISWKKVRNVMDMRAVYGGFAAALRDLQVWVLNVVNVNAPDTLPIIYERGLFGIYHDWCEGFSTYPRTYDLLHADHLFSRLKERCKLAPVMAEIDRIVRPGGKLIVRDESSAISEVENSLKSLHWEVHLTFSKDQEGILSAQKSSWRPNTYAAS